MSPLQQDIPDEVRRSLPWERPAALGAALVVTLVVWLVGRWIGSRLEGRTKLGLHDLDRLAAPLGVLAGLATVALATARSSELADPVVVNLVDVLAIGSGFWLASRVVDVVWATVHKSARLRSMPAASGALLAGRQLGRVALVLAAATAIAVRLGAANQLYIALTALGAALAFAARDPIRNAVAFIAMVLDPPFHLGDRVRIVDFRGGEEAAGEVVRMTLSATTIRTSGRTLVILSNINVSQLRVENLSAANRRRLELTVPISDELSTEAVRAACDAIERRLRESPHVTTDRAPRVWISGVSGGMRLEASMWLHREADRREAQRDLLIAMRAELEGPARDRESRG